jgi:hypothetical protein
MHICGSLSQSILGHSLIIIIMGVDMSSFIYTLVQGEQRYPLKLGKDKEINP